MFSAPLLLKGYNTALCRSTAMATSVTTEEAAPNHDKFPPVTSLHRTKPPIPSGCTPANLTKNTGAIKIAYIMSATARLTIK